MVDVFQSILGLSQLPLPSEIEGFGQGTFLQNRPNIMTKFAGHSSLSSMTFHSRCYPLTKMNLLEILLLCLQGWQFHAFKGKACAEACKGRQFVYNFNAFFKILGQRISHSQASPIIASSFSWFVWYVYCSEWSKTGVTIIQVVSYWNGNTQHLARSQRK